MPGRVKDAGCSKDEEGIGGPVGCVQSQREYAGWREVRARNVGCRRTAELSLQAAGPQLERRGGSGPRSIRLCAPPLRPAFAPFLFTAPAAAASESWC